VLVPVIIARILQGSHSTQTAEEAGVEKVLLKSISDFVKQSKAHQLQMQAAFDADARMRYQYLLFQQQQQPNAQAAAPIPPPVPMAAPFTLALLSHLRLSLKSVVMVSVGERKDLLRQSLLGCRPRAEVGWLVGWLVDRASLSLLIDCFACVMKVLHTITQIGDSLAELADEAVRIDWTSIRETFMAKLDD
jgi:hypothetical protein